MEELLGFGPNAITLKAYETSIKLWRNSLFRTLQDTVAPEMLGVYVDRRRVETTLSALGRLPINKAKIYRQELAKNDLDVYAKVKNEILARVREIHHANADVTEELFELLYEASTHPDVLSAVGDKGKDPTQGKHRYQLTESIVPYLVSEHNRLA